MTISDWIEIALDIKNNYDSYDGFVVIHGTDTMAYSVSALSFMLENLGKSVVFTGSQVCVQYSNLMIVSVKLLIYPSPKSTLTLSFQNVGLGEG